MVHPPVESVTVVVLPSDDELVEKLPDPPVWVTVPPGPVVLPLTLPSPAVMDVDMPELLPPALSPFFNWTTLQLLLADGVDVLLLLPPLLVAELLELLVCADAAATAMTVTARDAMSSFTSRLLCLWF